LESSINIILYKTIVIISFIILIYIYTNNFSNLKKGISEKDIKKKIFTFWEPKNKIPGYLKLCIETWKKFLPEYEIEILDYETVKNYLGEILFSEIICKNMTLPIQADAIRVSLLQKYGGIWMDTDIIILNGHFIKELENYELSLLGEEKFKSQSIGFIYAKKNTQLINKWLNEIKKKVGIYKNALKKNYYNMKFNNSKKLYIPWNYLGNSIIDKILKNTKRNIFLRLDRNKINDLPEKIFFKNTTLNPIEKYRNFYFQKREFNIVTNNSKSLIYLHNSWTPLKYKNMSEKQFLKQDILLANLLRYILNKSI